MFGSKDNAKRKEKGTTKACGIKLGDRVRDTITGFEGTVTSITRWLNGCDRVSIQPTSLDDKGQPKDANVFDVLQLEVVEKKGHKTTPRTGGPREEEKR